MQLTVRDVAKLLQVTEKTIYRWIKQGDLPVYRIRDQYRFNRIEILEWATSRRIGPSAEALLQPEVDELPPVPLSAALEKGGIYYRVTGADKPAVLESAIRTMWLPDGTDREFLLSAILAREEMASTGIGDGIAIPHARSPIVLHVEMPFVGLCFLERPVDFAALDGEPVQALFVLFSPTVRSHLHLLSRLAFALRDPGFLGTIQRQALREEVLSEVRRVEGSLEEHAAG